MQRVTVTLDEDLVADLDRFMAARGYQNRSEAVRDLARAGLRESANVLTEGQGACVAALVYVYDHQVRDLAKRLTDTQHEHHDLSVATMHVHLDHDSCLEVALLRGARDAVARFAAQVTAERGVRHGQLFAVPVDIRRDEHTHGEAGHGHGHAHEHIHAR